MTDEIRDDATDGQDPTEEMMGQVLRRHGSFYHDPPATPREALWARIEAARGTLENGAAARGERDVIPLARRRWWPGALAVAAVLALGIALGRISMRDEVERQGAAGPPVASGVAPADREPESGSRGEPAGEAGIDSPAPGPLAAALGDTAPGETRPATRQGPVAPLRAAPRQVAQAPRPEPEVRRPAGASPRDLYRLASQQMLGQAEALLVQYRTDRAAARVDPAVGRWARDVLSSTRLLLDSPAAKDPSMRDLLEDLELVLAQIVQRTGQTDPLDDELIDRAIEDRDLMPRLRGAIPVGIGAI